MAAGKIPKLELTENAREVLRARYLWKAPDGTIKEKPEDLFARVAKAVASAEKSGRTQWAERFYEVMCARRFIPNSPTLMNAGRPEGGQLSACYVLPVEDSLESIFDALKYAALIHQSGGGTGFSFSHLRAKGSIVKTTHGAASGPVSFIKIFDSATDTIKQGGTRRGANMAILRVDHPDIEEFIDSKRDFRTLLNFNISVAGTDEFMRAVLADAAFSLRDPRTGKGIREVSARGLFSKIAEAAWECGDPGFIFLDRIDVFNPTPRIGKMESTNPCVTGETRIFVEGRGLIPIQELVDSRPSIITQEDGGSVFRVARQVIRTGIRTVYKMRTLEGYSLRLTADHRVSTERGDVPAEELECGDRVRLLEIRDLTTNRDTREAQLGEILGWLTGDGHFTNHENNKPTVVLSFYGEDKIEAAPRLLSTVQNLINDGTLQLNTIDSRDLKYIRSQRLRLALEELGVSDNCKRSLPEFVWRGNADLVAGYLRGLFSADGSTQGSTEKGTSVRLASNALDLLRDVQLLLLRIGIKSVIYENRRLAGLRTLPDSNGIPKEYPCAAQHELVISKTGLRGFAMNVGFLIQNKQSRLDALLKKYSRGPYKERFYATVTELTKEGEEDVYDITEPETSHFFANGVLVHNCGEQPLLPFESCNLGSLNLGLYLRDGALDWDLLREDVRLATRFLDNVIDINEFPLKQCEKITLANRKIGLGVMGFADLLLLMNIPYSSEEARVLGEKIMAFIDREAKHASAELAKKKGAFPNWKGSLWERLGYPKLRNATVSTVAPTGTISMIAGASSGIEPIYSGIFYRNVLSGARLQEIHPAVQKLLSEKGATLGSLSDEEIGERIGAAWTPASTIAVADHVRMQAAFQRFSDSAVSKTINLPESATVADVSSAYLLAYQLGCKGITVYRDRSRPTQVLERPSAEEPEPKLDSDVCPSC